jgi:transposase-like protein
LQGALKRKTIEAQSPHTVVQSCVVHLIRVSMRFVSYANRKPFTALLRTVSTAVDALDAVEDSRKLVVSGRRRSWSACRRRLGVSPESAAVVVECDVVTGIKERQEV